MQLRELQQDFVDGTVFDASASLLDMIVSDHIAATDRFAAYKNNVYVGLFETLRSTYPSIVSLVGEDFFRGIVRGFVHTHPPRVACLDEYGHELADFLCSYKPAQRLAYLPDVARFEWEIHQCSIAENDLPLNPLHMQNLGNDAADTPFPLRSHIHLLSSHYPLIAIWRMCRDPENTPNIDMHPSPRHFAIFRSDDYSIWLDEISPAYMAALSTLKNGHTVEKALESAITIDQAFDAQAFFVYTFTRELFKGTNHA